MSDIQKKFYVLRAISGKENKVREYLEAELKNTDLGEYVFQVLIPTEKTFTVRNGKKVMKERAYLPGYVLVEAALVGEVAHRLRNIPNVIGFLGGSFAVPLFFCIFFSAVFCLYFFSLYVSVLVSSCAVSPVSLFLVSDTRVSCIPRPGCRTCRDPDVRHVKTRMSYNTLPYLRVFFQPSVVSFRAHAHIL